MLGKLVDPLYINFIFSFQCIPLSINVYLYINVFYVMYLHIVLSLSDICRHIVAVLVTGHRQRGDWEAPGLHHAASKYKVQCDCPNI